MSVDRDDKIQVNKGYVALRQALTELQRVKHMDNILAHTVRTLGAIEDTLYQYATEEA